MNVKRELVQKIKTMFEIRNEDFYHCKTRKVNDCIAGFVCSVFVVIVIYVIVPDFETEPFDTISTVFWHSMKVAAFIITLSIVIARKWFGIGFITAVILSPILITILLIIMVLAIQLSMA